MYPRRPYRITQSRGSVVHTNVRVSRRVGLGSADMPYMKLSKPSSATTDSMTGCSGRFCNAALDSRRMCSSTTYPRIAAGAPGSMPDSMWSPPLLALLGEIDHTLPVTGENLNFL